MKYQVGTYVIVPEKPFETFDEAAQYINEKYPELDRKTIEKHLTPKVKENGGNKSGNTSEENSISPEVSTKAGAAGTKGIKSDADKSR